MTTAHRNDVFAIPEWTLGWRLQRSLAHAGMSVEQIAEELGVTRGSISRWMHDRGAPPRLIYIRQWALTTGVPLGWLVAGDEPTGTPARPDASPVRPIARNRNNSSWCGSAGQGDMSGLAAAA